jgi:RHS repeat-associated protein
MRSSPGSIIRPNFSLIFHFVAVLFALSVSKAYSDPVPSNYVAYSYDGIIIGDRAGTSSEGLIGSQGKVNVGMDAIVHGSIFANDTVILHDRSQTTGAVVSEDSVIIGSNVSVGSITQHASVESYMIPVKSFSIGTSNFTVPLDGSGTLLPGNYKTVHIFDRGTLNLGDGIYNVDTFVCGNDVHLILDYTSTENVEINAKTRIVIGDRVKMYFTNDSNSYSIRFYSDGTDTCKIGYDGYIVGNFTTPNAALILYDRTKLTGILYAKKLELQPSIYGVVDTISPSVQLVTPVPGSTISTPYPRIALFFNDTRSGIDWSTLQINLNGSDVTPFFTVVNDSVIWQVPENYPLPQGANVLIADIFDRAGNGTEISNTFHVQTSIPEVVISSPQDGLITNQQTISVIWSVDGVNQTTETSVSLQEGENTIIRSYTNGAGRTGADTVKVILDTHAPVVAITSPQNGATTNQSTINVSWSIDGVSQTEQLSELLIEGVNTITRSFTDAAGNTGSASVQVTLQTLGGNLPPDPSTIAPELSTTSYTNMKDAVKFLYSSQNPVQTGIDTNLIDEKRVAVVRGKVLAQTGEPLSGVTISIHDHPEFGQTLSREDGMFDLVVNGGSVLIINYEKENHFTTQRQSDVAWKDYARLPDVIMLQPDPVVSTIDLNNNTGIQIARGSISIDTNGSRQATIIFPPGIEVTNFSAETINVRATEYTVGHNGPKAMPAELPSGVGYTYCVELSVDGAEEVQFNAPVYLYVENFLNFPSGGIVPAGYYDRTLSSCNNNNNTGSGWIPSPNGRIISITSIENNHAMIDIDGNGIAEDASALSTIGITSEEQVTLASLYSAGQSLWRVPVTHFSPWDLNWGTYPPEDAESPDQPVPEDDIDEKSCEEGGSIIEVQNQVLREKIDIVGTSYSLNYSSEGVAGRTASNYVKISLTDSVVPASLQQIYLEIIIAGKIFNDTFAVAPNLTHTFTWDGFDCYGRKLQGKQKTEINIGYAYNSVYMEPVQSDRSFGLLSGVPITGDRARQEIVLWQKQFVTLGTSYIREYGIGGWSLNVHHLYNQDAQTVRMGNGKKKDYKNASPVVNIIAGNGNPGYSGDGGPATQAEIREPWGISAGPDGSIYFDDQVSCVIRRVDPTGTVTTIAGSGQRGYSGDGGPATQARLDSPRSTAVGSDGSIYIADAGNNRIRKICIDGTITTIAGNGIGGYSGDGGPADLASIFFPSDIAESSDGSVYFCDAFNYRIRRIDPDGVITTIAGTGVYGYSGDGGPAIQARIGLPTGLAVSSDGSVYYSDGYNNRIRKVDINGIITTFAGNGIPGFSGDGFLATDARLDFPAGIACGPDGSIYIGDFDNYRIRKVNPQGIITTFAGDGKDGCLVRSIFNRAQATATSFCSPASIVFGPDGKLYVADAYNLIIANIMSPLYGSTLNEIQIPSEDGTQRFQFDAVGKHQKTTNSLTGSTEYRFHYDQNEMLDSIIDGYGNATVIERDGNDNPTAIVGPYGDRTILGLTNDGYLNSVTNPANETVNMSYYNDGLLASFTDARNNSSAFMYDSLGRLVRDTDARGGFTSLQRLEIPFGFEIRDSSAEGRVKVYRTQKFPDGTTRKEIQGCCGGSNVTIISPDETTQTITADSTIITTVYGPDPRFGMQAPMVTRKTIRTPSGLEYITKSGRIAEFDSLGVLKYLTSVDTINNNIHTAVYNDSTRTFTSCTPEGLEITAIIDSFGKVIEKSTYGIDRTAYEYDSHGRLTAVREGSGLQEREYLFIYGADGNVQVFENPLNEQITYTYDDAGRITIQELADSRLIRFGYDVNGNIISVNPPANNMHEFMLNNVDGVVEYLPPTVAEGETHTLYGYNLDRKLIATFRPDGDSVTYAYDGLGRVTQIASVGDTISYDYDPYSNQLLSVNTSEDETISYSYDGSLVTKMTASGNVNDSIEYTYNNNFDIVARAVAGVTDTFGYDNDGLVTAAGNIEFLNDSQNGRLTGTRIGNVTDTMLYNSLGELSRYTVKIAGVLLYDAQFERDKLGRITQKTETNGDGTHIYQYVYNSSGYLESVSKDGIPSGTYTFDLNGNRLSYTGVNGSKTGTYDAQDRMLTYGNAVYTYSPNGEYQTKINGDDTTRYQYDNFGNLKMIILPDGEVVEYLIDGQNRRIGKKVNGTLFRTWMYESKLRPAAEYDGAGNLIARYIYGSKINVPEYMVKNGVTYRIITDYLGSVRYVIDVSTGTIALTVDYDEYGVVEYNSDPGFTPFGFAGGMYDHETGLVRFGARDYDAESGRWTCKDPIGFESGDFNFYRYVDNSPIYFTDPTGLCSFGNCLAQCTMDQLGITTILGAAGAITGMNIVGSSGKFSGATKGTSIASKYLSQKFPQQLPFRVPAPTFQQLARGKMMYTKTLGRALGRWVPVLGWALLTYDAVSVGICTKNCMKDCDPCK